MPVLYARRSLDPADARLLELLDGDLTDAGRHRETLGLLRSHPAVEAARADLDRWAATRARPLAPLPDGPAKRALESLCDFVVARTR